MTYIYIKTCYSKTQALETKRKSKTNKILLYQILLPLSLYCNTKSYCIIDPVTLSLYCNTKSYCIIDPVTLSLYCNTKSYCIIDPVTLSLYCNTKSYCIRSCDTLPLLQYKNLLCQIRGHSPFIAILQGRVYVCVYIYSSFTTDYCWEYSLYYMYSKPLCLITPIVSIYCLVSMYGHILYGYCGNRIETIYCRGPPPHMLLHPWPFNRRIYYLK